MRRRIAGITAAIALMLGVAGAFQPSDAGTLCAPGCVLAGTAQAIGGVPDPTFLNLKGQISILVDTRYDTGAVSTGRIYDLFISGPITTASNGTLSGQVSIGAYSYVSGQYEDIGGTAAVSGTQSALRFTGTKLNLTLVKGLADYQGLYISH
jgi:hypothetical protein